MRSKKMLFRLAGNDKLIIYVQRTFLEVTAQILIIIIYKKYKKNL